VAVGLWALRDRHVRSARNTGERGAALGLGMLHGTAGAGHLLGVLPLLGLSPSGGALYCAGFVLAGIFAMAGAGTLMGQLTAHPRLETKARPVFATLSLMVGMGWIANALLGRIS
jgi:hypothetical protein